MPQIGELMKHINKYIRFEAETRMAPLSMFAGAGNQEDESDADYHEVTEDDVNMLAQILSGG